MACKAAQKSQAAQKSPSNISLCSLTCSDGFACDAQMCNVPRCSHLWPDSSQDRSDDTIYLCCRGKNSKTSDMGMYGTSKLYLLMFTPGLQQRLRVSHLGPPQPQVMMQPLIFSVDATLNIQPRCQLYLSVCLDSEHGRKVHANP